MDFTSWFTWDLGKILFWSAVGGMVWLISLTNDLKNKIKSPVLVGFAASLFGAFEIGLTSLISGAVYLLFLHVFKYWYIKLNGKEFKGIEVKDDDNDSK